ncbi:MAG: zinc metallopeptidase [Syntrophomonadaceae bacterium]|nr:zinc metallopeptidase [Syntrophomonadaceae bacterium]MDH7498498.1 zinc metallopeptidase [Syntrophomonadaceae bacterium]
MFWDPTIILLIPAIVLAAYAQFKTQSTFARYSRVASRSRLTGAELARRLLASGGLAAVPVERVAGTLSDHYDPTRRVLRLSEAVYGSDSVAALGVAAHEVGHALQHQQGYLPLQVRNSIVPVANLASSAAFPLLLLGLVFGWLGLVKLGALLFTAVVAFQLVTLPVEFNASHRAVALLSGGGYLAPDEIPLVRQVLGAAALTYVAAALMSLLNLARFLLLAGMGRED